jgi:RNA polymerase sigma-70 factor (ECF subfamily)
VKSGEDAAMEETKTGRFQELERLVRNHQARLRTYIFSRTGNRDVADDLVQEVFLIAWKNFDKLDPTRTPLPWLLGIARNEVRAHWRNKTRENVREELQALAAEKLLEKDELAEGAPALDERVAALRRCLDELPSKSSELIQLMYSSKLNCEQIAQRIEANGGMIRMAIFRVRRALRSCVEVRLAKGEL